MITSFFLKIIVFILVVAFVVVIIVKAVSFLHCCCCCRCCRCCCCCCCCCCCRCRCCCCCCCCYCSCSDRHKSYIKQDYWYVSHSKKCQYIIVIAHLFCTKYKPFQTLYFVNIVLKLEWPINVRRYFGSCKVCGKGNSVIFINREILPGPEDARICFTFFKRHRGISMKLKEVFYW